MAVFMFNDRRQQQEQQEMKMVKSKSCWNSLPKLLVQSNIAACLSLFIFFFFNMLSLLLSHLTAFTPQLNFVFIFFFNLLLVLSVLSLGFKLSSRFVFC